MPGAVRQTVLGFVITGIAALLMSFDRAGHAQSPDSSGDEAYIRGLIELELDELLEHYLSQVERDDRVKAALLRISVERIRLEQSGVTMTARESAIRKGSMRKNWTKAWSSRLKCWRLCVRFRCRSRRHTSTGHRISVFAP